MPLHKVVYLQPNTKVYLWKISEDYDALLKEVRLKDSSVTRLTSMKSESHQKGFLAVRMILQHLGYTDFDLIYDAFGKPHLKPQGCSIKDLELSISHSQDFSAVAISEHKVGLDLEQLKDKILKIAPRFMDVSHLENLSTEEKIKKATVIWGIKESIFKLKNEVGISFQNHIFEANFSFEDKTTTAQLLFNNKEENFKIHFNSEEDYIFVCAFQLTTN
jgi:phosphopantetheinyl transferase